MPQTVQVFPVYYPGFPSRNMEVAEIELTFTIRGISLFSRDLVSIVDRFILPIINYESDVCGLLNKMYSIVLN